MTTTTKARELADQVVSAINARDHSQIDKLTTDNVQLRLPPDQVFFGRQGVRDFVDVLDINSTTRSGHQVEGMGAVVLELEDGRIDRVQVYLDTAQWAQISEGSV